MLENKRKKIEVINRGRVTGRTTELIRRCAKHNYALIVTPSKARAQSVFGQARSQGIYIPFPITFKEFCRGEFCGRNVDAFFFDDLDASLKEMAMWAPIEAVVIEGNETNTGDLISRQAVKDWIQRWIGYIDADIIARMQCRVIDIPSAKPDEEQEIKRLRELAARILGKYEEEKKKQLAAVRLASLRGSERDRAKELQARTEREIENLRKEIKGE